MSFIGVNDSMLRIEPAFTLCASGTSAVGEQAPGFSFQMNFNEKVAKFN